MTERREARRVTKVLEATWRGQSAGRICRVTDIGAGGCFVDTMTAPQVDQETDITLTVAGQTLQVRGTVRYVEPRMGFGVQFATLAERERRAIGSIIDA